jgi:predicted nucleic acid-binding Zn ribbon protein
MDGLSCVVCQKEIPAERDRHRAVTCSSECKKALNAHRRKRNYDKVCQICFRPSTPEEREMFKRWRRETFPPAKRGRPKMVKPEDAAAAAQEATGV